MEYHFQRYLNPPSIYAATRFFLLIFYQKLPFQTMKTLQKKSRHCKSFAVTTPSFLKNTIFFLSFLLLGFGSELKAQESVDKDVKPHNWEIGLDIRPFFDTPIKVGVMVKRSLRDKTKAIRFRTAPGFYNTNNKTFPGISGTNFLNGSFDIGLEKRIQNGKFVFYYGTDLRFIYRLQASNIGFGINQPNPSLVRDYYRYVATGIGGIIGGKFFINHRLSISSESMLTVIYGWARRESGTVDYNLKPINLFVEESSGVDLALNGISAFMISYHF